MNHRRAAQIAAPRRSDGAARAKAAIVAFSAAARSELFAGASPRA